MLVAAEITAQFSPADAGNNGLLIQRTINDSPDYSTFLLAPGFYPDLNGPWEFGNGKRLIGYGAQLQCSDRWMIELGGTRQGIFGAEILTKREISPTIGEIIRVNESGASQCTLQDLTLRQNRWQNGVFVNYGECTEFWILGCSTFQSLDKDTRFPNADHPAWYFQDSIGSVKYPKRKITSVVFDRCRFTHAAKYAIHLESVDESITAGSLLTGHNLIFERCPGGAVKIQGGREVDFQRHWFGDLQTADPIKNHVYSLEGSAITSNSHSQYPSGLLSGIIVGGPPEEYLDDTIEDLWIDSSHPDKLAPITLRGIRVDESKDGHLSRINANGCRGIVETNCELNRRGGCENVTRFYSGSLYAPDFES